MQLSQINQGIDFLRVGQKIKGKSYNLKQFLLSFHGVYAHESFLSLKFMDV